MSPTLAIVGVEAALVLTFSSVEEFVVRAAAFCAAIGVLWAVTVRPLIKVGREVAHKLEAIETLAERVQRIELHVGIDPPEEPAA